MEAPIKVIFAGISGNLAEGLMQALRDGGFAPVSRDVNSRATLIDALDLEHWDAIIADCSRRHLSPVQIGKTLRIRGDETPLVVICDDLDSRRAIDLIKAGAADVLCINELDNLAITLKLEMKAARKRWRHRVQESETQVAATAFHTAAEGIMVTDRTGRIIAINPAFTKVTGHVLSAAIGRSPEILYAERHTQSFFDAQQEKLSLEGAWKGEVWFKNTAGQRFPVWLSTTAVTAPEGDVTEYVSIFRDITERKEREDHFRRQATYDPLTQLPNRTLFFDRLEQAILAAGRKEDVASLLFVDLDRFKSVNDTLGHAMGDKLLKQVAERLQECVRDCDTVARIGGDEFAIVLEDDSDGSAAIRVATKTITALNRSFDLGGACASIGCSIGISMFPEDGEGGDDLLSKADEAMYQAKSLGRGRFHFFEPTPVIPTNSNKPGFRRLPTFVGLAATMLLIIWMAVSSNWLSPDNNIIAQEPAGTELNDFNTAAGAPTKNPSLR